MQNKKRQINNELQQRGSYVHLTFLQFSSKKVVTLNKRGFCTCHNFLKCSTHFVGYSVQARTPPI